MNDMEHTYQAEVQDAKVESVAVTAGDIAEMYSSSIVVRRWAGTLIDSIILCMMFILAVFGVKVKGGSLFHAVSFVMPSVVYIVVLTYYFLLEGLTGYTIGKAALRIRAVDNDFNPPGMLKAFLRTITRPLEVNPFLLGGIPAGIIAMTSKKKQRLGDMAANTYVIEVWDLPKQKKRLQMSKAKKAIVTAYSVLFAVSVVYSVFGVFSVVKGWPSGGYMFRDTVYSSDGKYQITIPLDWDNLKNIQEKESKMDILVGSLIDQKCVSLYVENKGNFDQKMDMQTFTQAARLSFLSIYKSKAIEKTTETKIDGYPATQFELTGSLNGEKEFVIATLVDTPDNFLEIIAWMPKEKVNSTEIDELTKVITSIKEKIPLIFALYEMNYL